MGQLSELESRYTQAEGSLDQLAKGMATGTLSRGRALRMLGAALVGGAFASIPGAAWAACKQPFSKCTANSQCCSRQCIKNPKGNGKICGCPTGKTLCPAGNQCVTCTNTGEVVNLTTCKCECPSGTELVNGACVSPSICTVNQTCGGCGDPLFPDNGHACRCLARADGTGNFCASDGVAASSCAECAEAGERLGLGLELVCVKCPERSGCDIFCAAPCYAEDGKTCGYIF
jgi:hypothetical protein